MGIIAPFAPWPKLKRPWHDVKTIRAEYRRMLIKFSWRRFTGARGETGPDGMLMFYALYLDDKELLKVWQEVYDYRTLLRPAQAGPQQNRDLLVACGSRSSNREDAR